MKIIITGGAGFIGSHVAEKLCKNNKVIIIDNLSTGRLKNIENFKNKVFFKKADLSKNSSNWTKYFKGVDKVFHFAALADIVPSIQEPEEYFKSNVTGTLNVLEACKKYKIKKIVYAASSSCYGIAQEIPTTEKANINPQYPYALTKQIGETLMLHWSKIYKINCTSLRLFNVYGPRSRTSGTYGAMFGVFFAQKIANKPFTIVGDGNQKRDFTHVFDIIDGLLKISSSKIKHDDAWEIGSGVNYSINELYEMFKQKYNASSVNIPDQRGNYRETLRVNDDLINLLNWKPKDRLREYITNLNS